MKVKKYIAQSMPDAMKKIRQELGTEAVILSSREIQTGGFLGFFTKPSLEVVAAIDPEPLSSSKPTKKEAASVEKSNSKDDQLLHEIQRLHRKVHQLSERSQHVEAFPNELTGVYRHLVNQEIAEPNLEDIMKELTKKWYQAENADRAEPMINDWMKSIIKKKLAPVSFSRFDYSKKLINLVGPTGVGKTTTIAKIAAYAVLKDKKKVALITTDTYRIAAIEQLKTYAEILNIPIEVAYTSDDFKNANNKFESYDLILVDSAGRNFRNRYYVDELQRVLLFNEEMETYLVLSLTSKYKDMQSIYDQFTAVSIDKVIFTKQDETSCYGALFNLAVNNRIGIAYITNGQNVPDDIIEASIEKVASMIAGEETDE
jgi:flagellar biosynthesis protein FlhF